MAVLTLVFPMALKITIIFKNITVVEIFLQAHFHVDVILLFSFEAPVTYFTEELARFLMFLVMRFKFLTC